MRAPLQCGATPTRASVHSLTSFASSRALRGRGTAPTEKRPLGERAPSHTTHGPLGRDFLPRGDKESGALAWPAGIAGLRLYVLHRCKPSSHAPWSSFSTARRRVRAAR